MYFTPPQHIGRYTSLSSTMAEFQSPAAPLKTCPVHLEVEPLLMEARPWRQRRGIIGFSEDGTPLVW